MVSQVPFRYSDAQKGGCFGHPRQNETFGQVLCVRKTDTQSYAVDLTGQLASCEKRTKCKPNVDMKSYLPVLTNRFGTILSRITIFQFWKIVPVRTLRKSTKLERNYRKLHVAVLWNSRENAACFPNLETDRNSVNRLRRTNFVRLVLCVRKTDAVRCMRAIAIRYTRARRSKMTVFS